MNFQDAMITPKVEEDLDPGLADWFKVDEKTAALSVAADDDSATENDSDHADVAPATDEVDLDDWFEVKPMIEGSTSTKAVSKHVIFYPVLITFHFLLQDQHDVKMGENEAAMEYDQEFIFKHLQVAVFPRPGTLLISRSDAFIWIPLGMRSNMG